jgi:hypothetical protein
VADRLAQGIAEHPEDWHMLQRMWTPASPDGSRAARAPAGAPERGPASSGGPAGPDQA